MVRYGPKIMAALEVEKAGDRRVVLLAPLSTSPPELPEGVSLVRVAGGYEAAAEMLSAPAAVLAADLGCITAAHVQLLELAARMNVPVVAFGTISTAIPPAVLQTLRLVDHRQLAQALRELLDRPAKNEPPKLTADEPAPEKSDMGVLPMRRTAVPAIPATGETPAERSDATTLTPEELLALLGRQP